MEFYGQQLLNALRNTRPPIEVRTEDSFPRGSVTSEVAEQLARSRHYIGVGDRRGFIHFLKPLSVKNRASSLHAASETTQRVRNAVGILIAPDYIREHRDAKR